ncbi:hypothetical protein J4Q44_G00043840 [Coregonus suidteri]|uniref:Uncharacterized protein n=1 Tax=Coregonus suidteri TaxID=861788 RepID=A0AAN8RF19_9TELE
MMICAQYGYARRTNCVRAIPYSRPTQRKFHVDVKGENRVGDTFNFMFFQHIFANPWLSILQITTLVAVETPAKPRVNVRVREDKAGPERSASQPS